MVAGVCFQLRCPFVATFSKCTHPSCLIYHLAAWSKCIYHPCWNLDSINTAVSLKRNNNHLDASKQLHRPVSLGCCVSAACFSVAQTDMQGDATDEPGEWLASCCKLETVVLSFLLISLWKCNFMMLVLTGLLMLGEGNYITFWTKCATVLCFATKLLKNV